MKHPRIYLLFLLICLAPATFAMPILISETRSVTVGIAPGSGGPPPLYLGTSSTGTFGLFSESRTFSVGNIDALQPVSAAATATQTSNITASGMTFDSTVLAQVVGTYNDPIQAAANSSFAVTFQLLDYTAMSITAYSTYFSGDLHLVSGSGDVIPLSWGGSSFNELNFNQQLAPGVYTLSSSETTHTFSVTPLYNSSSKHTTVNVQFGDPGNVSVPDNGSGVLLLALALTGISSSAD